MEGIIDTVLGFLGRMHPLFLHLPIGIFVLLYLQYLYDRFFSKRREKVNLKFGLQVAFVTSVLSAASGYLLSLNGGYEDSLLSWHKYSGIALTVMAGVLLYLYVQVSNSGLFGLFFTALMLVLGATGHMGGSLTHGEDFLWSSKHQEKVSYEGKQPQELYAFQDVILPIVKAKCISCHNESKTKGELLMTTVDGWKKGGENGTLLEAGKSEASLLIKRILLPLDDEEHMPPKGKVQLDEDEIKLLRWWIDAGADFESKVAEVDTSKSMLAIISSKYIADEITFDEVIYEDLKSKGYRLSRAGKKMNQLALDMEGTSLSKEDLVRLKPLAPYIVSIDLSNAKVSSKMIDQLLMFENLSNLDLAKNDLETKDIKALKGMKSLESLNLYGNPIDDAIVEVVQQFPLLKELYLWDTNVTDQALAQLSNSDKLQLDAGYGALFADARLAPPTITAGKDIFKDTITITLTSNLSGTSMYYTLDGSEPSQQSEKYSNPIVLNRSAIIKAIAMKEGWNDSNVSTKTVAKSKYEIASINLEIQPSERYAAKGGETLNDFVKGSEVFTDGNWLGFEGDDCIAAIDLGKQEAVQKVGVSTLSDYVSYIFSPIGVTVLASDDNKDYRKIGKLIIPPLSEPEPKKQTCYIVDLEPTSSRYLKVIVENQGQNPPWHPAPKAKSWIFLDEITVE